MAMVVCVLRQGKLSGPDPSPVPPRERPGAYDGGRVSKGGIGTLDLDDRKVADGRIEKTAPFLFGLDSVGVSCVAGISARR